MNPSRLSKAFNIAIETITLMIVLSIPLSFIVLIVYSQYAIEVNNVCMLTDSINDAS